MHARQLPARTGRLWLREAYLLYRKNPPLLTSATMAYLLVAFGVGLVPIVGPYCMPLVQPTLAAMLANVCALVARGQRPARELLTNGVRDNQAGLFRLGGLQLGVSGLLLLLTRLLETVMGFPADAEAIRTDDLLIVLVPLALMMLPFFMAFWFAPILVAWHGISPIKALFFSFIAVWRNLRAFILYFINMLLILMLAGLLLTVLTLLVPQGQDLFATVIQFLLLMVLVPMLMTGVFISYRDVFENAAEKAEA